MTAATPRQLNAIAAFYVHEGIGDPERAGERAYTVLEAAGFDMTALSKQSDPPHDPPS